MMTKGFLLTAGLSLWAFAAEAQQPGCVTGLPIPAAAAGAGYNTLTLGPNITLGENWLADNHDGGGEPNLTKNADGSLTVAGGADTWNAQMESAEAFGGGFYAQATMRVPGPTAGLSSWTGSTYPGNQWPSWWANSVNGSMETDIVEQMGGTEGQYGVTVINSAKPSGHSPNTGYTQTITAPGGNTLHGANSYGMLWVPATATSGGSLTFFLNGNAVGQPLTWTRANPGTYGIIDGQQMILRFGAGANSPATFSNVQVWQASTAQDSIKGQPAPPIAPQSAAACRPETETTAANSSVAPTPTPTPTTTPGDPRHPR